MLFIVLVYSLFACAPEPEFTNKDFTVMSFNIRTFGLEDAKEKFWGNRKELVLEAVRLSSPEIVGFQELKKIQYDYLVAALPEYEYYGENCWPLGIAADLIGGYNAVFFKKERFSLITASTLWLSPTPDCPSTGWDAQPTDYRTLTQVKLEDKLNKKSTTVINTHLPYQGVQVMQKASEIIAKTAQECDGRVIVMGDFNYQQDTPNYGIVTADKLKDCKKIANTFDEGGTFHSFKGYLDKPWPLPIDFILIDDTYFNVLSHKIIRHHNEQGHYPSDHYPVEVVLQYKEGV